MKKKKKPTNPGKSFSHLKSGLTGIALQSISLHVPVNRYNVKKNTTQQLAYPPYSFPDTVMTCA